MYDVAWGLDLATPCAHAAGINLSSAAHEHNATCKGKACQEASDLLLMQQLQFVTFQLPSYLKFPF